MGSVAKHQHRILVQLWGKSAKSRSTGLDANAMLHVARRSEMRKLHRSIRSTGERQVWAVCDQCCTKHISTLRAESGLSLQVRTPRLALRKRTFTGRSATQHSFDTKGEERPFAARWTKGGSAGRSCLSSTPWANVSLARSALICLRYLRDLGWQYTHLFLESC
jgi:hypothetical protein